MTRSLSATAAIIRRRSAISAAVARQSTSTSSSTTTENTECEIDTSGALKDAAKKVFRGTIDFKTGSSNSVGNEKETVLMLGDDVVNKTVPLILCAEENVVGNHGATIGELDDETLFYFESRGISRAQAENILARASIERFARTVDDEVLRAQILQTLEEELNDDV